jgi:hypothetical protein
VSAHNWHHYEGEARAKVLLERVRELRAGTEEEAVAALADIIDEGVLAQLVYIEALDIAKGEGDVAGRFSA